MFKGVENQKNLIQPKLTIGGKIYCAYCVSSFNSETQFGNHIEKPQHKKAICNYNLYKISNSQVVIESEATFIEPVLIKNVDNVSLNKNDNHVEFRQCNNSTLFEKQSWYITLLEEFTKIDNYYELETVFSRNEDTLNTFILELKDIKKLTLFDKDFRIDQNLQTILNSFNSAGTMYINAIAVKGDGNCFYRAISVLFYGKEDYFCIIKIASMFIMYKYKDFFEYFHKTNQKSIR